MSSSSWIWVRMSPIVEDARSREVFAETRLNSDDLIEAGTVDFAAKSCG